MFFKRDLVNVEVTTMMSVGSFIVVMSMGSAGALGALTRYVVGRVVAKRIGTSFPWGTLFINGSGAFVIGLLSALAGRKEIASSLFLILATGFLGGYTTFSTMSWESVQLVRGGSTRASILYLGSTIILGLVAAGLGLALGWVL